MGATYIFLSTTYHFCYRSINLFDGGRCVARREKINISAITTSPERTTLRARSFPKTSVIISLIVKIKGIVKIATDAFNFIGEESNGKVFAPINSEKAIQKI